MDTPQFIHLRLHSEFSIVDGLVRIDDLVKAAVKDGQPAVALTDLSNCFGLIKFYQACTDAGIKPIAGCDVWISNPRQPEKPSRLLILVKNHDGYLQLCELLSRAWLENQNLGRAEIRYEWLREVQSQGKNGLIALSGAQMGDIGLAFENGNDIRAEECARFWAEIFPDHFYIEVQRAGHSGSEQYLRKAVALADKLSLPVVATHPVQFINKEEFSAHEARICISEGDTIANPKRPHAFNEEQYFLTQTEMLNRFADIPDALTNTVEIAKRCNLVLDLFRPQLPDFPTPDGVSLDEFLVSESKRGLEERLKKLFPDETKREQVRAKYEERLQFEINTIIQMGFSGYFLIVADFIQWAKNNGVPVGPGRGSGAGSLVAYSLKITELDPIAYNLLFERFLNPERVSMPDFDIDFCQEGRDRVIQYVKDRYGANAVSQIATFGTMAARAAIRDVGRVLDLGYNFCDGISKLIPNKPGKHVTISEAKEEEPLLAEREENEDEVKQLLDLAEQVEGITRNVGMHAGGVLIAPGKLTNYCPLYRQDSDEAGVVSQYDKGDVEAVGLVKFDFLGLVTLTILDWTVRYIRMINPEYADFNLDSIPLDDKETYELLTQAKTVAVFQLESRGMQGMLKEAKPDRFEDIIALVALFRPGPMDLIPEFCNRKHGEPFDYPDPRTESILSETYGIMVYQEQVMQMAQIIGGYSLGEADLLRRAMGKKKPEEMAQHRDIFRKGAAKNGLSQEKSDEIFDLMEKFAGYGFNKSHAAAYALLAYQTAYLKVHFPTEFMAANMSFSMGDTDKIKVLIDDAVKVCGIEILPPDINLSEYRFVPVKTSGDEKQIRYGLGAIRTAGQGAIEAIIEARKERPFSDLFDFCQRMDKSIVNRGTLEFLVRAGVFDSLYDNRASLFASVPLAIEAADQIAAAANQISLFGSEETSALERPDYVQVLPWDKKYFLKEEKIALGFYFSGHLYDVYAEEIKFFAPTHISDLKAGREPKRIAGIISDIRDINTRRGRVWMVTLDDDNDSIEVYVPSELYDSQRELFKKSELLIVQGVVSEDRRNNGVRMQAEEVWGIVTARLNFGQYLYFNFPDNLPITRLLGVLSEHKSEKGLPLILHYQSEQEECDLRFGNDWKFLPTDVLKTALSSEKKQVLINVVYQ